MLGSGELSLDTTCLSLEKRVCFQWIAAFFSAHFPPRIVACCLDTLFASGWKSVARFISWVLREEESRRALKEKTPEDVLAVLRVRTPPLSGSHLEKEKLKVKMTDAAGFAVPASQADRRDAPWASARVYREMKSIRISNRFLDGLAFSLLAVSVLVS